MAKQVKIRRGTAAQNSVFTGAQGEVVYLTDTNELVAHDGSTVGGHMGGGYMPAGTGAVATDVQSKFREQGVSVVDKMTSADRTANYLAPGSVDLTYAFAAAAADIVAASGGKLIIPFGTYRVGKQTFAGATGLGYAYRAADIVKITGCTKPVIIESHGAKIQFASGLKFGSFDPVTGLANAPALPNTNQDYGADVGIAFNLTGNSGGVAFIGALEIDGNLANATIGGQWGDTGYQRMAYGINENGNASFFAENVYVHHHATDGISCGYTGAVDGGERRPKTLINVVSEYNARQGLSWIGGIGLTAINCKFNNTGKAINAGTGSALISSPGAGLDIEAESAVNRHGVFINCEFGNNAGYGMVADAGDSADIRFVNCQFYGITQNALWSKKPRMVFDNCLIAGGAVQCYVATNYIDRVRFNGCTFSADKSFNGTAAKFNAALADYTGQNPIFTDCEFVTNQSTVRLQITSSTATYRNCTMTQNGSTATALPRGTFEGINTLTMTTGSADMTGTINYGKLNISGTVSGIAKSTDEIANNALPASSSIVSIGSNGAVFQELQIISLNTAPTTGTWAKGDKCINNQPAVGSPKGWICTVAGTPGTWVSEGNL